MYIGICEDDTVFADWLEKELSAYYGAKKEKFKMDGFVSGEELLFKYPENVPFDCLILDIRLREIDGMELARRIRKNDEAIPIIFLTGDQGYVFDGYKVGAVRYLLKPVKMHELIEAIELVGKETQGREKDAYISLNYEGEYMKLRLNDIISIQVKGHYVTIYMDSRNYMFKETISNIQRKLGESFVRVGRSAIVNLENVERISREYCIMKDGSQIPVSRSCYASLNQSFIKYYK